MWVNIYINHNYIFPYCFLVFFRYKKLFTHNHVVIMTLNNYINRGLQEHRCTMFGPQSIRTTEHNKKDASQKQWTQEALDALEKTISQSMIASYKQSLVESLGQNVPITYINCDQKDVEQVWLFILEQYMKWSTLENKKEVFGQIIGENSMVEWINIDDFEDLPSLVAHYKQSLWTYLTSLNKEKQKLILWFEDDVAYKWIAAHMDSIQTKEMYLYLDNVSTLSSHEKQSINNILFCRWSIGLWSHRIYIKINDWKKSRNTWKTTNWHIVQDVHDYSHRHIKREEITN